jgi:trans-feruloyl-CoA hydratase/vanillin synthase
VTKVVQEIVQPRQALYYILTGEPFDGKKAAEIGLITQAVPKAELESRVLAVANTLKQKDPETLRACKEAWKAVSPSVSYEDAWYWLSAKVDQLAHNQKNASAMGGIERFMQKEYRPGLGSPEAQRKPS